MYLLDNLAERRIVEALERGDFDHLPGAGKPLTLDELVGRPYRVSGVHRRPGGRCVKL